MSNLARLFSAELDGIGARVVEIEVDLHAGLHAWNIVGLADKALNEARERVNSALKNSGAKPPSRENRKITINLAPADMRKTGSQYDLAIALGYLVATEQMSDFDSAKKMFLGELALDGRLRPVSGALNIAEMARAGGFEELFITAENANEASAIDGLTVVPIISLSEAMEVLEGKRAGVSRIFRTVPQEENNLPDFSEIKGQAHAKRALTIAAAGGHNVLLSGVPGVGKSMLASALAGILPKLTHEESIEVTKAWSAYGAPLRGLISSRPFRAPHQTASTVAIIGGGTTPCPGEVSLAHRGVLFLDELPEFSRAVLEALRTPLESGWVRISRARGSAVFPAKFILVAAMNPCPCGFYGDTERECSCAAYEIVRYRKKISGPLLDRIDLQVNVPRVDINTLRMTDGKQESAGIKKRIEKARQVQAGRLRGSAHARINSEMSSRETERFVRLGQEAARLLDRMWESKLSPRGYYRLLKTARTIADLDGSEDVEAPHLAEAFSYRLQEDGA